MKLQLLVASLIAASSAIAQNTPAPSPTPFTFTVPVVPPGTNSAAFAAPRADWFLRVQSNNAKAQPLASKIELVFDGDSITDFWQNAGKEIWAERYGKLNAFDFGISGDRTQSILWRLANGQMDGIKPKLICLMIGTNNLGSNTPEQIAEGIKAIVAEYQKRCPDAAILLQGVFPRAEKAEDPARAKIKTINEIISKLADGKKVIFVDFGDKFLAADGTLTKEIMPDALHPGPKGYQIWADAIQPVIDQFFQAQQQAAK